MSGLHVWNQQCFSKKKMKFYDVRLKNYVVLFARQGRGLNHSGGNSEGRPSLGEGGGYSVFQVMGMIEWDRRALLTTNLQIVLNTQTKTNPYLSQATQKNTCQIFLPKKLPQTTISNPQKFFEHPLHLKFGVPYPPSRAQSSYETHLSQTWP